MMQIMCFAHVLCHVAKAPHMLAVVNIVILMEQNSHETK